MAPLTNSEVIATERPFAVMASQATLRATGCVMVKRFRRRDLSPLGHSGSNLMAFVAGYFFMLCVAESHPECLG
jgi:hypothetical protein